MSHDPGSPISPISPSNAQAFAGHFGSLDYGANEREAEEQRARMRRQEELWRRKDDEALTAMQRRPDASHLQDLAVAAACAHGTPYEISDIDVGDVIPYSRPRRRQSNIEQEPFRQHAPIYRHNNQSSPAVATRNRDSRLPPVPTLSIPAQPNRVGRPRSNTFEPSPISPPSPPAPHAHRARHVQPINTGPQSAQRGLGQFTSFDQLKLNSDGAVPGKKPGKFRRWFRSARQEDNAPRGSSPYQPGSRHQPETPPRAHLDLQPSLSREEHEQEQVDMAEEIRAARAKIAQEKAAEKRRIREGGWDVFQDEEQDRFSRHSIESSRKQEHHQQVLSAGGGHVQQSVTTHPPLRARQPFVPPNSEQHNSHMRDFRAFRNRSPGPATESDENPHNGSHASEGVGNSTTVSGPATRRDAPRLDARRLFKGFRRTRND